jgi:hypothetical protein
MASLKTLLTCQTEPAYQTGWLVEVFLGYEKPQVGFDWLPMTNLFFVENLPKIKGF